MTAVWYGPGGLTLPLSTLVDVAQSAPKEQATATPHDVIGADGATYRYTPGPVVGAGGQRMTYIDLVKPGPPRPAPVAVRATTRHRDREMTKRIVYQDGYDAGVEHRTVQSLLRDPVLGSQVSEIRNVPHADLQQLAASTPLVRSGGVVGGLTSRPPGADRFVIYMDATLSAYDYDYVLLHEVGHVRAIDALGDTGEDLADLWRDGFRHGQRAGKGSL